MNLILIGLTGKMGSGKSVFSSFFKKKGIPIYYSDKRGKILMNNIKTIQNSIIKNFGKKSYVNNKVNKNYLSNIVFKNPVALKILCSIIHPWISFDFKKWIISLKKKKNKNENFYVIKESAILFESGSYQECNNIITITSPLKKIIERIIKRDNLSEKEIFYRLKNQISNKKRKKISNIIVDNSTSFKDLKEQANNIYNNTFLTINKKIFSNGKRR
ncbi:dephospho-CoA kinase [Blattabacterium cuenoti]|uniref:dephospho-CoA kinase n=1 Tax=Blattabacterium cuenoti TaxID=1653831 RepID=UPI00163C453F|nr:dephospho-CoA kinase [Blattabacterium cuenoti]